MKTKEQWEQEVREDTLVDADQLVDWIGEIQSDARTDLEAENKALNEQVNALIGRCKELAAEIMPLRERAESAEASLKERDLQMKAALEETESMFQRTQRAEAENVELREQLDRYAIEHPTICYECGKVVSKP